ncbi:MAG: PspC domain-containing protein [Bacillota bacterium]
MKRLYRSRRNRVIGGVCGGIAGYLAADVSIVRLAWVLFSLVGGAGILLYILAWIIVPEEPVRAEGQEEQVPAPVVERDQRETTRLVGIILVAAGAYLLLQRVIHVSVSLWPLLLVLAGVLLLVSGRREEPAPPAGGAGGRPGTGAGEERDQPEEKTSYEE